MSFGRRCNSDSDVAVRLLCRNETSARNCEERARLAYAAGAGVRMNERRAIEPVVLVEEALDRFDRKRNEGNAMPSRERQQRRLAGFRCDRGNALDVVQAQPA